MNKSDYDKYYKKGGTYVIPIEIFNELFDELEKYKDIVLDLENERDILKSKLSEIKADIHYLLENGESIYIRNKYLRGDKDE